MFRHGSVDDASFSVDKSLISEKHSAEPNDIAAKRKMKKTMIRCRQLQVIFFLPRLSHPKPDG